MAATKISSDAQQILAGASPEAVAFATQNAPGNVLTSGEAQRLIGQFNVNPQSVYSTSNITNAVTNPTPAPDDLLGIRTQIGTELGIPGLQTGYQSAFSELQKAKDLARQQQTAIEGLPQALGVIRGEQSQAGRLASVEYLLYLKPLRFHNLLCKLHNKNKKLELELGKVKLNRNVHLFSIIQRLELPLVIR